MLCSNYITKTADLTGDQQGEQIPSSSPPTRWRGGGRGVGFFDGLLLVALLRNGGGANTGDRDRVGVPDVLKRVFLRKKIEEL